MPKNYYIILGIPSNSSQQDIKEAYRRLAKEYHPDYYGDNQTPFRMINEAYGVLSDPGRRKSYDTLMDERVSPRRQVDQQSPVPTSAQHVEPLIPPENLHVQPTTSLERPLYHHSSMFEGVFDEMLSGFAEERHPQYTHTRLIEINLTAEQAERGGNVRIQVPLQIRCPSCNNSGLFKSYNCWRCSGKGFLTGNKQLLISYPSGVQTNHSIEVPVTYIDGQKNRLTVIFNIQQRR
jgi:molecular chaperone DnaJ